jgi:hypothetical protein
MSEYPFYTWQYMDNKQQNAYGALMDKYVKAMDARCYELAGHIKRELAAYRATCYRAHKAKVLAFEPVDE